MNHKISCPNCDQHIIIDLPERGPVQIEEPVRVCLDFGEVFKLVFFIGLSIVLLGGLTLAGLVILGGGLAAFS